MSDFIARVEAELRNVDPSAAAFVRALHDKHGSSRASMNLLAAILAGDAAIVNVFTKHRDDFGCGEKMDELVREARARLAVAERRRVDKLREEFAGRVSVVLCEADYEYARVLDNYGQSVWYVLRRELCGLRPHGSYNKDW